MCGFRFWRWGASALATVSLMLSASLYSQEAVEFTNALWAVNLGSEIKWQRLTLADRPLIQTDKSLLGIDGATGKRLWEIAGLVIDHNDVNEIGDLLILNVRKGLNADEPRTVAVDTLTGKVRWQNESIKGRTLTILRLPERNRMLLVNSQKTSKSKASTIAGGEMLLSVKPELYAVDIDTGNIAWTAEYRLTVDLLKGTSTFGSTEFTITGLPQPIVLGNALIVPWSGLTRYETSTGRLGWVASYKTANKRQTTFKDTRDAEYTNAFTIADGVAYTSAVGVVRAIDLSSGKTLWTAKGMGTAVPQLFIEQDRVYAKMGGVFYQPGHSRYVGIGKNGMAALDKRTGSVVWKYTTAEGEMTNAVRWRDGFVLADASNIYGIGSDGAELFRHPLHFGSDPPYLSQIRGDDLEVRSEQHRAAFNLRDGVEMYTVTIPKAGVPPWRTVTAVGVRVAARVGAAAALPVLGQVLIDPIDRAVRIATAPIDRAKAQKPGATPDNAKYDFFLAATEEDKQSTSIVRVDRTTGEKSIVANYGRGDVTSELDMLYGRMYSSYKATLAAHNLFGPRADAH